MWAKDIETHKRATRHVVSHTQGAAEFMIDIVPVILSGGAGSRLWPLSTTAKPKQFHALYSHNSMFSDTLARVSGQTFQGFGPPIVVCGVDHEHQVRCELQAAGQDQARIILEPLARNTAPALAAAALAQAQIDPDCLMLVLPADHVIARPEQLHQACAYARDVALSGAIVTFAITPSAPETGYGYIKSGARLAPHVFEVQAFRES
ncbi:MAG: NTP transferase domain-containing protein [Hyphomonadaceae bacterium]|nr:NTP transferase domain-containing protein [Hyphomonadaceae bacterium]